MTVDPANRLGLVLCRVLHTFPTRFDRLRWSPRTAGCLRTGWSKHGLLKGSSETLSVPILSYRSSTSRSTARPESPRCPTKPEPIMTCGCAGKPQVLKYPSISLCLGGPFRMNTGASPASSRQIHWFLQGAVHTVIHPEVYCILRSWKFLESWVFIIKFSQHSWNTQPHPVY